MPKPKPATTLPDLPNSGMPEFRQLKDLKSSPENFRPIGLYDPILPDDSATLDLVDSIKQNGFASTLVISLDDYILSGHRRHVAAQIAGLTEVPCLVDPIYRNDPDKPFVTNPAFIAKLEAYNRQRVKSLDEQLREAVVRADPDDAHRALTQYRRESSRLHTDALIELREYKGRARISKAKIPFMNAIKAILNDYRQEWPLSDRFIHYTLLNDPPLKHATKPNSYYQNDKQSYNNLTDLLTRMRLEGEISFDAIDDETRAQVLINAFPHAGMFLNEQADGFLKGYYRDLQQSQPNHIEIVYEKNTGKSFVSPVALEFCVPLTIGRGYSSLAPRVAMARRYRRSSKEKLIIVCMSDLDPDGDEITHSFARSMRDDFRLDVECVKAALTMEQVKALRLPPNRSKAKTTSTNYAKYIRKYATRDVYELEALSPAQQRRLLTDAIVSVLDVGRYNDEISIEKSEAAFIDERRQRALMAMGNAEAGESNDE